MGLENLLKSGLGHCSSTHGYNLVVKAKGERVQHALRYDTAVFYWGARVSMIRFNMYLGCLTLV